MKTLFYTLIFSFSVIYVNAQITFDDTDLPTAGDSFEYLTDTLTAGVITPGAAGASQIWNLPSLNAHNTFVANYVDATTTPFSSDFPTANVAIDIGGGNYVYYENTATYSDVIGLGGDPTGTGIPLAFAFDNPQRERELPMSFGDSFTDNYSFTATIDGSAFQVDSIRITRTGTISVNADAWGVMNLPGSGPYDVLRTFVVDDYTDVIEAQTFGFWIPVQTVDTEEESYVFLSEETKGALVTMNMDGTTGDVLSVDYANLSVAAVPEADFTFMNSTTVDGGIDFMDSSTNAPDTWLWDFGDGNTSTLQNPSHTFATSGTYNVCLTSSNSAGSDVSCQNVTIVLSSISNPLEEIGMEVFPNPVVDNTVLSISESGNYQLTISDITGKLVFSKKNLNEGNHPINLGHLSQGTYIIRLTDLDNNKGKALKITVK